ncbi:hypothetical protein EV421DRAFT_1938165, partial [Armillaria borealis]
HRQSGTSNPAIGPLTNVRIQSLFQQQEIRFYPDITHFSQHLTPSLWHTWVCGSIDRPLEKYRASFHTVQGKAIKPSYVAWFSAFCPPSSCSRIRLQTTMPGNKVFRTSVVRSAAVAMLKSFQTLNVRWAIYGDLAWHLLCGTTTGGSWRLDVHVMGDSSTLAYATQHLGLYREQDWSSHMVASSPVMKLGNTTYFCLSSLAGACEKMRVQKPASVDHRFSVASPVSDGKATMTYDHDVLNDGSLTKKHQCKVKFVSSHMEDFFIVKDLPLLPIQSIIYRRMEGCVSRSEKKLKKCMSEVIAIGEAYLRLPNLPPPAWSITPAERPLFLDHLAKITAEFPETADLFTHLHPGLFPTATIVPTAPSIVLATRSDSTIVLDRDVSSLSAKERKLLTHSETVLTATRTLSFCIHQLGHECFLAGPGYVPWYIMGSPIVPTSHRIDFLVILRNGNSLDSLQRILCQGKSSEDGSTDRFGNCRSHLPSVAQFVDNPYFESKELFNGQILLTVEDFRIRATVAYGNVRDFATQVLNGRTTQTEALWHYSALIWSRGMSRLFCLWPILTTAILRAASVWGKAEYETLSLRRIDDLNTSVFRIDSTSTTIISALDFIPNSPSSSRQKLCIHAMCPVELASRPFVHIYVADRRP